MDDDFDLAKMLDEGDRPAATPDVLRQVVARHHRRRARQYRVVASTAIVIALAGAGLGVGLDNTVGTQRAAGPLAAPSGLRWDSGVAITTRVPGAEAPTVGSQGVAVSRAPAPEPGEFGFSTATAAPSAHSVPADSRTNAGGGYGTGIAKGCTSGCGVVYSSLSPRVLFTRHVDGLTLTASLEPFAFPVALGANGIPVPEGTPASSSAPPSASSAGTTSTTSKSVHPSAASKAVAIEGVCPVARELVVTIVDKDVSTTLFVPAGGPSGRAFSVVASAATGLGANSIALAVAHTSASVAWVSARFESGASDAMAPRDGWVVLAQVLPSGADLARAGTVTLTATLSSGGTLETASLPAAGALATAPAALLCRYLVEPVNSVGVVSPPSSGASAGSGSASTTSTTSVGAPVPSPSPSTTS
ncbi:MAG TPA: hypothetical protein VEH29_08615 [Acidimicrobiales bacterium]|nr:hypothetical protein [Acidimicrobiales bacterium]